MSDGVKRLSESVGEDVAILVASMSWMLFVFASITQW
ncbi:hypothetical protein Htur_3110 [Haloterrigena turkmenica DSM 5511]|uniref:Uncharacterized protein n=1 Tax=Haloterrigena turkmenica (strain ATCC 51198 / DSM 5511 / JCM 9101 / NCIMB 13204 / VKM B-1734 / 4k) TaxID=543526 RepID=D2RZ07_HALTV|nr:hypothetical protein Htur_3110 [Haloterrigena turkmenica DSM 5511]